MHKNVFRTQLRAIHGIFDACCMHALQYLDGEAVLPRTTAKKRTSVFLVSLRTKSVPYFRENERQNGEHPFIEKIQPAFQWFQNI